MAEDKKLKLVYDPKEEKRFQVYSSLLDLRERLRAMINVLSTDAQHLLPVPKTIAAQLKKIDEALNSFFKEVDAEAQKHKPKKTIQERGYSKCNRFVGNWKPSCDNCQCDSGGCGGNCGGNCGGGSP